MNHLFEIPLHFIETLEEILHMVNGDDPKTCVTRRHILRERMVSKDLTMVIKYTAPDTNELQLTLQ